MLLTLTLLLIPSVSFAYGTSSCYIAAALNKNKIGKLTSVDLLDQSWQNPSIEEQLDIFGLRNYVDIHRMKTGYNWFLHNEIVENTDGNNILSPKYDLIIIDGPKDWIIDSSSFFLCDKLLKNNGWIIFDDYNWAYKDSNDAKTKESLSEEEKNIPHIKEIFHFLVQQHPSYNNFIIEEDIGWAWAQKVKSENKKVNYITSRSFTNIIYDYLRRKFLK